MKYIIGVLIVLNIAQYVYHRGAMKRMQYNLACQFFHNDPQVKAAIAAEESSPDWRENPENI